MSKFNVRAIQALGLLFNIKQLNKRSKTMNKIKKTFAIALTVSALIFNPVSQASAHNNDAVAQLNASQAKGIARQYLSQIGFARMGTSIVTAVVKNAELRDDTWVVHVLYGGTFPRNEGIVLVDNKSGEVKQTLN